MLRQSGAVFSPPIGARRPEIPAIGAHDGRKPARLIAGVRHGLSGECGSYACSDDRQNRALIDCRHSSAAPVRPRAMVRGPGSSRYLVRVRKAGFHLLVPAASYGRRRLLTHHRTNHWNDIEIIATDFERDSAALRHNATTPVL